MTRRDVLLFVCLALALPSAVLLAAPAPTGFWLTAEGTSVVRIEETGGRLSGAVVWLKEPAYKDGDTQGRAGRPRVDEHNPDTAKRDRKLLGMQILWGFAPPDAKGVCTGGEVYDPRNGKTYSGTITMVGPDRLELRGYVLVSLIGRSSTWTRVDPGKYGLKP